MFSSSRAAALRVRESGILVDERDTWKSAPAEFRVLARFRCLYFCTSRNHRARLFVMVSDRNNYLGLLALKI